MRTRRHWLITTVAGIAAGCKGKPKPAPKTYPIRGKVVRLQPAEKIVVLDHEAVEGWMGAMTMGFPVRDQRQWDKLKDGQTIRATVYLEEPEFWLGQITVEQE